MALVEKEQDIEVEELVDKNRVGQLAELALRQILNILKIYNDFGLHFLLACLLRASFSRNIIIDNH